MSAAPGAQMSKLPASLRPSTFFRNASLLSTARLFSRRTNHLMTRAAASSSRTHALHPRQQQQNSSSQSLTFGFAFMAILLSLLFFAHLMQRFANRRQREVLARMAALQEARELEEVPKLWDVHLTPRERCTSGGKEREGDGKLRWKDIQPLSTHAESTDLQSSAGPHDRPLRVSVLIAMPDSPRIGSRRDSGKCFTEAYDSDRLPYYELGVATVK